VHFSIRPREPAGGKLRAAGGWQAGGKRAALFDQAPRECCETAAGMRKIWGAEARHRFDKKTEDSTMKGVIAICLSEVITKKFGTEKWQQILQAAGLPKSAYFLPQQNIEDAAVLKVIQSTCSVLDISLMAAAEAFGEYWCCDYAPRMYKAYYSGAHNAKEFLLRMKDVHDKVTRTVANARPPVFSYEQPAPNKLIMKYSSHRHLEDVFVGLVKGVGRHFREDLQLRRVSTGVVEITFAA
jgi:hypothetical protein